MCHIQIKHITYIDRSYHIHASKGAVDRLQGRQLVLEGGDRAQGATEVLNVRGLSLMMLSLDSTDFMKKYPGFDVILHDS